jgi:hypothetical protein
MNQKRKPKPTKRKTKKRNVDSAFVVVENKNSKGADRKSNIPFGNIFDGTIVCASIDNTVQKRAGKANKK